MPGAKQTAEIKMQVQSTSLASHLLPTPSESEYMIVPLSGHVTHLFVLPNLKVEYSNGAPEDWALLVAVHRLLVRRVAVVVVLGCQMAPPQQVPAAGFNV